MFKVFRQISFIGKILIIGIFLTGVVYLYSLSISHYIFSTLEKDRKAYIIQNEHILQKIPQEKLTFSGNEYSSPVYLITQKEIDAIEININPDFDNLLSESIAKNKRSAVRIYDYCYFPLSKKSRESEIQQKKEIDAFCEQKDIPTNKEDARVIANLQTLSDTNLAYQKSYYDTWHVFPFTEEVRGWGGEDYFGMAVILFISLGIWELLVFIISARNKKGL